MVRYMWNQINTRTLEVMLFCIASGKGDLCYSVRKDLIPSRVAFLRSQKNTMASYHHNRRYKGAKSIWDWTFSDWIAFAAISMIIGIIYYFSKP